MKFRAIFVLCASVLAVSACGNTVSRAISTGENTYIMTTKAKPSPFGVANSADMGSLIEEGSATCTDQGLRFVLLERQENEGHALKMGGGSIEFKCVE
ncbi:hypothetical protein GCM10011394_25520 [Luteimonas terricola]|uniref:Lipoprotein n=1 Tax=Luteimonas terricola TaxID=645597 RepID=A0ABQ2EL13_9GAMM|nr:hypothetical protein GCM10011394_25520 [Luteimonas terricola]